MSTLLILILFAVVGILMWALLGERSAEIKEKKSEEKKQQDRVLRRRASDKEIEEQFPDSGTPQQGEASPPASPSGAPLTKELELPYSADEIIPATSRFRIYTRTLMNGEIYAKKKEFATAISLFQGVHDRINDTVVREKIEADIDYLEKFKEELHKVEKQKAVSAPMPGMGEEVRLKIDGQLPNSITINTSGDTGTIDEERIAKVIGDTLKDQMNLFQQDLRKLKLEVELTGSQSHQVDFLQKELSDMRGRMDELKNNDSRDITSLREEASEISSLRQELNRLNDRLHQMTRIPESSREPAPAEARFQAAVDPAPIVELLEKLPKIEPTVTIDKVEAVYPQGTPISGVQETVIRSEPPAAVQQPVERQVSPPPSEEDEGPEEFELMKDRHKEEDDGLSDEDILEKILSDKEERKENDTFEIMAERNSDKIYTGDTFYDKDSSKEDRDFYRKLLKTDKWKRKELPILKVSYDFSQLPDEDSLSRDKNLMSYSFYRYKPLLDKAAEYIKKRKVRDAINYYQMVMNQNIPPEFKIMIRKNINDLNEYLEKYLTGS